jgi:hypothetical protein
MGDVYAGLDETNRLFRSSLQGGTRKARAAHARGLVNSTQFRRWLAFGIRDTPWCDADSSVPSFLS